MPNVYTTILKGKSQGRKLFAVLIDPDKFESLEVVRLAEYAGANLIMVGGSILTTGNFEECVSQIKKHTHLPVIIFPGNNLQISKQADAILLLSLISGRNPDFLIGKHVIAAPELKRSNLEIIPTGYLLIDSGKPTSASYISNTTPIPYDKVDIALCTAMAGEMLGLQLIYLDAGSGAQQPVNSKMIREIAKNLNVPLAVGGGICKAEDALKACEAGADIIVVGNAIEKDPAVIEEMAKAIHEFNTLNLPL